jgi:hypothetical protein
VVLIGGALTVATGYLLLVKQGCHWQWVAFLAPFSSAFFVFMYEVQYLLTRTRLSGFEELAVYFGYAAVVAVSYGLLCAAAGFLAANTFVRVIFKNLELAYSIGNRSGEV